MQIEKTALEGVMILTPARHGDARGFFSESLNSAAPARAAIEVDLVQAGGTVAVCDIPTADYSTPAPRPLNSRLDYNRLQADLGIAPPDWRTRLRSVLTELRAIP